MSLPFPLAIFLGVAGGLVLYAWIHRPFPATARKLELNLAHIAWLFGGPARVNDALLTALVTGGWLTPNGKLASAWSPNRTIAPPADPLLSWALSQVPAYATQEDLDTNWSTLRTKYQDQLITARLMVSKEAKEERLRHTWPILFTLLGLTALSVVLDSFSWMLLFGGATLFGVFQSYERAFRRYTTAALPVLELLKVEHAAAVRAPTHETAALAVAIGGWSVLVGTPHANGLPQAANASGGSSSGCGGVYSDSSSSSGGGDGSGCGSSGCGD